MSASGVNDHSGILKCRLAALSRAVSWTSADTAANDALLHQLKPELPAFIGSLLLFSPDGTNIGTSSDAGRSFVGDRAFFRQILAGQRRSISEVIPARTSNESVVTLARPVHDNDGRLRAVLAVGR